MQRAEIVIREYSDSVNGTGRRILVRMRIGATPHGLEVTMKSGRLAGLADSGFSLALAIAAVSFGVLLLAAIRRDLGLAALALKFLIGGTVAMWCCAICCETDGSAK